MILDKEEQDKALEVLKETYKDRESKSALNFSTPFEALVAVILSAQCTDERVNIVTDELFKEHNTPETMLNLSEEELKKYIKSCGLANAKAKNILKASRMLIDEFDGELPRTHEEMMRLPGVGRKTANVVLANVYDIPGLGVDTHVNRVSKRIGLTEAKNVTQVERDLCEIIPKEDWNNAHHWFLWHGRELCKSRKPECEKCPLSEHCLFLKEKSSDEA